MLTCLSSFGNNNNDDKGSPRGEVLGQRGCDMKAAFGNKTIRPRKQTGKKRGVQKQQPVAYEPEDSIVFAKALPDEFEEDESMLDNMGGGCTLSLEEDNIPDDEDWVEVHDDGGGGDLEEETWAGDEDTLEKDILGTSYDGEEEVVSAFVLKPKPCKAFDVKPVFCSQPQLWYEECGTDDEPI